MQSSLRSNIIPIFLIAAFLFSGVIIVGCKEQANTKMAPAKASADAKQDPREGDFKVNTPLKAQRETGTQSFALPPRSELLKSLPPEERELLKNAKKSVGYFKDKDGNYTLIEVDGKQIHEGPAVKYLEEAGIKGKMKAVEIIDN